MRSIGLASCVNTIACVIVLVICNIKTVASQRESGKYRIDFPEEQEPGTVVANLADLFSVRKAIIPGRSFGILGQKMVVGHNVIASDGNWLAIDSKTGIITVNQPVDRETECGDDSELECVILLQATMMPQAHFRLQKFELVVTDVNDHSPKFPKTGTDRIFSLNISEDTPELTKISLDQFLASDEDINENAMIYYSISRNDHFGLNQYKDDTGASHLELVIVSSLDYEDVTTFDLTLTAKDRGTPAPRSSQVFLRVNVLDANDNVPTFDESVYNLELRENLPAGHVITTVVAHDADSGRFGKVRYFIPKAGNSVTARKLITVDPETGAVKLLKPLDRELRQNLRVVIGAKDQATKDDGGSKTGKTVLMIQIMDVNDNAPRIDVNVILKGENNKDKAAYVPENAALGTYVAHVSASDADSGESGRVTLSITTVIDQTTDSAALQAVGFRRDSRKPSLAFVSNNFILKPDNLIATNVKLDREIQDKYIIKITACDNENPRKCSNKNVSIVILDANDNKPHFRSSQKSFTLAEDTQVGSYITTVKAFDEDSLNSPALVKTKDGQFINSRNGEVRYSLTGGGAVFAIDSKSGKLTLVGTLDYEMKRFWKLIVTAQDLGEPQHKTNFTLSVKVTDINDHKPEFTNPGVENMTAYATILEDHPIIRIKTIDRDAGNNAKVWYSIASEDGARKSFKFLIDPVTGSLRLNTSNKLTELLGEHTLIIKARDKGSPPKESQTRLIVKVTDVPLSSIIPNYADTEEAKQSSRITVIVLATLASATVILLLVLACIVVKCRKENKEIRKYNCRAAETKSGRTVSCPSKSSMSQIGSVDEVVVVSTPGVTTTKDVHFGRAMEINRSRSMTLANSKMDKNPSTNPKYATTERGPTFTTFSMSKKNGSNSHHGVTSSHTDRDSGKGESDKDSDSYGGDKDIQGSQTPSESNLQYCSGYLNELGPRCTIACRRYGHSDECWMPVVAHCDIHGDHDSFVYSDAGSEVSENTALTHRNYPPEQQQQQFSSSTNSLPAVRYGVGNFDNCGLETISETQPLRIVLDNGDQSSMYSCESYNQHEYPNYGQSYPASQYPNQPVYPPNYYQGQLPQSQNQYYTEQPDWRDMYRSQQQNEIPVSQPATRPVSSRSFQSTSNTQPKAPRSNNGSSSSISSSSYIPVEMPEMYGGAPTRPRSVCENNGDVSTGSVMEKVKRFSQAPARRNSLRDHVLNTRFLNNSMTDDVTDSRAEEASLLRDVTNASFSSAKNNLSTSSNGEVSLEETQKIISDIDNLISS